MNESLAVVPTGTEMEEGGNISSNPENVEADRLHRVIFQRWWERRESPQSLMP